MSTKTQVTDAGAVLTGTIGVYNQSQGWGVGYPPLPKNPETNLMRVDAGGVEVAILNLQGGWPGPPPNPTSLLGFAVYVMAPTVPGTWAHEFVYCDPGAAPETLTIERNFSIAITGRQLWREEALSTNYGRTQTPTFSADRAIADGWVDLDPLHVEASLGDLSISVTAPVSIVLTAIDQLNIEFDQLNGEAWTQYAAATNLKWSAAEINFSGMSKTYGNPPPGVGGKVTGGSGSLELTYNDTAQRTSSWTHGLPLIPDFSRFAVRDRLGALLGDLGIIGPFQATPQYPWTLTDCLPVAQGAPVVAGTPIILSVNQIRSIGTHVQAAGLVQVDGGAPDYSDAGYAYDLLTSATMHFSVWPGY